MNTGTKFGEILTRHIQVIAILVPWPGRVEDGWERRWLLSSINWPVDVDVARLTDAVTPILSLGIHCRIPVAVVEYHSISSSQVHPYTTRPCRKDETKDSPIGVEPVHEELSLFDTRCAVQAEVAVAMVTKERLEDV